jgi:hypothetical protein
MSVLNTRAKGILPEPGLPLELINLETNLLHDIREYDDDTCHVDDIEHLNECRENVPEWTIEGR